MAATVKSGYPLPVKFQRNLFAGEYSSVLVNYAGCRERRVKLDPFFPDVTGSLPEVHWKYTGCHWEFLPDFHKGYRYVFIWYSPQKKWKVNFVVANISDAPDIDDNKYD